MSTNQTFADLGLPSSLLSTLSALGYETPTPVQESSIPLLMSGDDVLAQAQTGTGKTFTMEGDIASADWRGIIPRSFEHVFNHITTHTDLVRFVFVSLSFYTACFCILFRQEYLVRVSFIEIYNDSIQDLLTASQRPLELHEHPEKGVYIKVGVSILFFVSSETIVARIWRATKCAVLRT